MESKYKHIRRCRLCGCEEKVVKLKEIFGNDSELNLQTKIEKLLPVVVMPWDPFPHTICSDCIDKLNLFSEFYDETLKTDLLLRKFFPSAPESETENVDPIIQITDCLRKIKTLLKLPPKNFPKDVSTDSFDKLPPSKTELPCLKTLEGFIINPLTKTDFIFTCRDCFRTFTKQSSALTHRCVKIEDSGEMERAGEVGDSLEKSFPPLKMCLFSTKGGGYECSICNKRFVLKGAIEKHLKRHSLSDQANQKFKRIFQNRPEIVSEELKKVECANDNKISSRFKKNLNESGSLDANNENLSISHEIRIMTQNAQLTSHERREPNAKGDCETEAVS